MTIVHKYDRMSPIYNFFFHPLHRRELKTKAVLSIITNIFLTVLTGGLWAIPFSIVNRLDRKKVNQQSPDNSEKVGNATSTVFSGQTQESMKPESEKKETEFDEVGELARVINQPDLLRTFSEDWQKNKDFISKAIEANPLVFEFATYFHEDYDVCLMAAKSPKSHELLKFVKNKKLVLQLICPLGLMVKYISNEFKKDQFIILKAMESLNNKGYTRVFENADEELKNDEEFVLKAVKINACNFIHAGENLRTNADFINKALQVNPQVADLLKKNRD